MMAENSDGVQPIKPQPLCPQRKSCSSQPVKVSSKQNRLLSIRLLTPFPHSLCVYASSQSHTHLSTSSPTTCPSRGHESILKSCHIRCSVPAAQQHAMQLIRGLGTQGDHRPHSRKISELRLP